MEVRARSLRKDGLHEVLHQVVSHGDKVSPRGMLTREVRGFTLRLEDPYDSLLTGQVRPNFSPGIAAAEAAQLIGGVSHPDLMVKVSKNFANFLNAGTFLGAYGPRVRTQLPQLVKVLKQDPDTRQALLQIWRAQDDLWAHGAKDIPCTTSLQFFIRNDKLCCHTYMRSNDVWWGLSYDAFQFTQLQCTLANILEIEAGEYVHTAGSMHVYERDFDKADMVQRPDSVPDEPDERIRGFGAYDFVGIHRAMDDAADVVSGVERFSRAIDDSTDWYWRTLEKYR